jgi:pentose-5-phosphate-3-epimerase
MHMKSVLLTWIKDNNQKHIPVDGGIKQKAMNILQHLQADEGTGKVLEFSVR